ncbi:MAG: glycerol kinase [Pseudomonadota bacterium]
MTKLILAIDQGTTGSSAAFYEADTLRLLSHQKVEFPQIFPTPGWVEHNPEDIWKSIAAAVESSWRTLGQTYPTVSKKDILCIGITNQRETCLAWNRRTGETAGNAIVWQDRRTAERCAELRANRTDVSIQKQTGLVCDPYFSATKMEWILKNNPSAKKWSAGGELCLGTIDSYLVYRMSGRKDFVTEHTNASRTMLYDLNIGSWSSQLTDIFEIPVQALAQIKPSSTHFSQTQGLEFLPDGIPITGILGDQQSALFGQGCTQMGEAKITYGTGAFLVMNTGDKIIPSKSGLLTTVAFGHPDGKVSFALEGAAFIAGAAVQYLRDQFGWVSNASDIESLAHKDVRDPNVLFVPALAGLGAPYWNPHARGALLGLSRGTSKSQVARAVLESIALQNAQLLSLMQTDSSTRITKVGVDGGASQNDSLMQFQANSLQTELMRPKNPETTSRGAAAAALMGLDPSVNVPRPAEERTFHPELSQEEANLLNQRWQAAASLIDRFHSMG